jgi:hypothetical protein
LAVVRVKRRKNQHLRVAVAYLDRAPVPPVEDQALPAYVPVVLHPPVGLVEHLLASPVLHRQGVCQDHALVELVKLNPKKHPAAVAFWVEYVRVCRLVVRAQRKSHLALVEGDVEQAPAVARRKPQRVAVS